MKIIYIIQDSVEDYNWNGEESTLTYKEFPSIAFETRKDAEKFLRAKNKSWNTIWEVNLYSNNEL